MLPLGTKSDSDSGQGALLSPVQQVLPFSQTGSTLSKSAGFEPCPYAPVPTAILVCLFSIAS